MDMGESDDDECSIESGESDVVAGLAAQVEDCVELLSKIASGDGGNNNDDGNELKLHLSPLLANLREAEAKCSQIQQRVDEAQCDILCVREEAMAAQRAKNDTKQSLKRVQADIATIEQKTLSRQQSIGEKRAKIADAKATNQALNKDIDAGSGWRPDQEAERRTLITAIEKGRNELDSAQSQLDAMRSQVLGMEDSVRQAEANRDEAFTDLKAVSDTIDALNKERTIEQQRKKRMESALEDVKARKRECDETLAEKNGSLQQEKESLAVSERRLKEAKGTMETLSRKHDVLQREIKSLGDKRQRQVQSNAEVESVNAEKRLAAKSRDKELEDIARDLATMKRQRDLVTEKIRATENDRLTYEGEVDRLKLEISKLENSETKVARKEDESQRRQIDSLKREASILQRGLDLSQKDASFIDDLIKTNEITVRNLDNELHGVAAAVKHHQSIIQNLREEKERHEDDAQAAQRRHGEAIETLREQEALIIELRKKSQDADTQLKHKQQLYEKMQMECHNQSTDLVRSQEEMDGVRRRFHILDRQINQLKDEISRTNEAVSYEHYQHFRADSESSTLKQDISKLHQQIAATELSVRNNNAVLKALHNSIENEDATLDKLKKEYCSIMSERDIACAHLVQKREDLEKLKLKIKSQQALLHHGEVMYQDQKEQMATISDEINALKDEKHELDAQSSFNDEVIEKCAVLERELLREQAKKKILLNELGRPINIHRWRFLEYSNPDRYSMVSRAHRLQWKILDTAQSIAEKEALVQDGEKGYAKIKSSLDRMPTAVHLKTQLAYYSSTMKTKTSELEKLNLDLLLSRRKMDALHLALLDLDDQRKSLESDWVECRLNTTRNNESIRAVS